MERFILKRPSVEDIYSPLGKVGVNVKPSLILGADGPVCPRILGATSAQRHDVAREAGPEAIPGPADCLVAAGLPRFRLYDLRHSYASHLIAERADIAYVANQLGHAKMTTTLLFYAHWFPKGDRRYIEQMERVRAAATPLKPPTAHDDVTAVLDTYEAPNRGSWHHFGTTKKSGAPDLSEAPDFVGGPSRTRTLDPLIKSQLLYQLS